MRYRYLRVRAFSLIEALVALSITSMAGAVLLVATQGTMQATNDAIDQTIAQGMANQLIDEVLGSRYASSDNLYETNLGPSSTEKKSAGRERFNDTDDYADFESSPPKNPWGQKLGSDATSVARHAALRNSSSEFANWTQKIDVYYVKSTDPTVRLPDSSPSPYRAVEVTIERKQPNGSQRALCTVRRVFCAVPQP